MCSVGVEHSKSCGVVGGECALFRSVGRAISLGVFDVRQAGSGRGNRWARSISLNSKFEWNYKSTTSWTT
jgi:hypothetical protein